MRGPYNAHIAHSSPHPTASLISPSSVRSFNKRFRGSTRKGSQFQMIALYSLTCILHNAMRMPAIRDRHAPNLHPLMKQVPTLWLVSRDGDVNSRCQNPSTSLLHPSPLHPNTTLVVLPGPAHNPCACHVPIAVNQDRLQGRFPLVF